MISQGGLKPQARIAVPSCTFGPFGVDGVDGSAGEQGNGCWVLNLAAEGMEATGWAVLELSVFFLGFNEVDPFCPTWADSIIEHWPSFCCRVAARQISWLSSKPQNPWMV
jgi:hypothetical protein